MKIKKRQKIQRAPRREPPETAKILEGFIIGGYAEKLVTPRGCDPKGTVRTPAELVLKLACAGVDLDALSAEDADWMAEKTIPKALERMSKGRWSLIYEIAKHVIKAASYKPLCFLVKSIERSPRSYWLRGKEDEYAYDELLLQALTAKHAMHREILIKANGKIKLEARWHS